MSEFLWQARAALVVAKKNAMVYYLKPPVFTFGIIFPLFFYLAFAAVLLRRPHPCGLRRGALLVRRDRRACAVRVHHGLHAACGPLAPQDARSRRLNSSRDEFAGPKPDKQEPNRLVRVAVFLPPCR